MRCISGAIYAGSPPASLNFVIQLEYQMEYDECTPLAKGKYALRRIFLRRRLLYSAVFGATIKGEVPQVTILSAPLHPHFGSYLLGWVTRAHNWYEYMCPNLFGPCACAHSTAAPVHLKACGSTTGACTCPRVQACQCSFCVVFAIMY